MVVATVLVTVIGVAVVVAVAVVLVVRAVEEVVAEVAVVAVGHLLLWIECCHGSDDHRAPVSSLRVELPVTQSFHQFQEDLSSFQDAKSCAKHTLE